MKSSSLQENYFNNSVKCNSASAQESLNELC